MPQRYVLTFSCQDTGGIVAAVSGLLAGCGGFILESAQLGDPISGQFFMRTVFKSPLAQEELQKKFTPVAENFRMDWRVQPLAHKTRMLIMVSRQLHCLNDLLHRVASGELNAEIPLIISNHAEAAPMAGWYGIPFYHLPVTPETKSQQENTILELADSHRVELVVLARYMQVLSPQMVTALYGRAINIHHSFLPGFKGAKPYHQAFARGVKIIGATAHYVSDELDEGPIIEQEVSRVDHAYTPEEFVHLGRDIECTVLSRAVKYHSQHRVVLHGNKTIVFK